MKVDIEKDMEDLKTWFNNSTAQNFPIPKPFLAIHHWNPLVIALAFQKMLKLEMFIHCWWSDYIEHKIIIMKSKGKRVLKLKNICLNPK